MNNEIVIRNAVPSDLPFVFDSWLTNYQHTSFFARKIKKQTFMHCHAILLNQLMDRPTVSVKIAGDADFTIFGYICYEKLPESYVVHYIYVRPEYQRLGIARSLLTAANINHSFEASHWTPILNEISKSNQAFTYNPYRI